ncbi:hypothetical protein C8Q76DRAFT_606537, partial [Earliella scabrosa]
RQFLWLMIHDGYMVGARWLIEKMSDELKARAQCATCGDVESPTHIFFDCECVGQELVWSLLKQTWESAGFEWKGAMWGTTFGAQCVVIRRERGNARNPLAEELWSILCTESLHLIWKLRCTRVIQNEGTEFTEAEVTNRWYAAMDRRLDLDRRSAAKWLGAGALDADRVAAVWAPVLDTNDLPPEWVLDSGVLVGIKRGR